MHLQWVLPVALPSDCTNAPSDTYESHQDSYRYTDCYTTEGDCIVLSPDALDNPHCHERYSACDSLCPLADRINMHVQYSKVLIYTLASESTHLKALSVCASHPKNRQNVCEMCFTYVEKQKSLYLLMMVISPMISCWFYSYICVSTWELFIKKKIFRATFNRFIFAQVYDIYTYIYIYLNIQYNLMN